MAHSNKNTQRNQRILQFIRWYVADHHCAPSVRDIQRGCQISSSSAVHLHLEELVDQGVIKRRRRIARGIAPVD